MIKVSLGRTRAGTLTSPRPYPSNARKAEAGHGTTGTESCGAGRRGTGAREAGRRGEGRRGTAGGARDAAEQAGGRTVGDAVERAASDSAWQMGRPGGDGGDGGDGLCFCF